MLYFLKPTFLLRFVPYQTPKPKLKLPARQRLSSLRSRLPHCPFLVSSFRKPAAPFLTEGNSIFNIPNHNFFSPLMLKSILQLPADNSGFLYVAMLLNDKVSSEMSATDINNRPPNEPRSLTGTVNTALYALYARFNRRRLIRLYSASELAHISSRAKILLNALTWECMGSQ